MEQGRNECYIGRMWCTERTHLVPAEYRFIDSHLRPLLLASSSWQTLCHSSPRFLFPSHWALMECGCSPGYPCLHHGITWFQIKLMALPPSSWGPYCGICHILHNQWCENLPPSSHWELLESRRKLVLSTLRPSWPHFSIRYTGTQ